MLERKKNISKTIILVLCILGIGCGVYFSFVLGLYHLEKKESKHITSPDYTSDSPIHKQKDASLFLYYYLRSVM